MRVSLRKFLLAVAMAAIPCHGAFGIETAGEVFVNVDAATLGPNDLIWTNAGTYTDFEAVGNPVLGMIATTPAVIFDGASAFVGMAETPDGLVGIDPTRSIEAWVFNPSIASEETVVSWGKRGGPDGTNMAFNYGNHGRFGAVGHWGGDTPDVGWIDNGPADIDEPGEWTAGAPDAGMWHHLVYTYDEEVARVYSDGVLWNQEDMTQYGGLNTHFDTAIAIASQWEADGVTLTEALRGSMAMGRLRIHDGVLSDAQIIANYNEEKGDFTNPEPPPPPKPEPIPTGPVNRYSFSDPAAADASGATIVDSAGGKNGIVLGDGASLTGTELKLNGGGSDFAAYVDLPNGLISGLDAATVESWVSIDGSQNWSRIFDFGSTAGGEVDEPGGGGAGQDYWMLSQQGGDVNLQRHELRNNDPEFGGDEEGTVPSGTSLDTNTPTELGEEIHVAAVYDPDGEFGPELRTYRNGELTGTSPVSVELGNINDVNNWLGRSNFSADANLEGTFNEFRIFDYALTTNQILGNFQAGPDALNIGGGLPGDLDMDGLITTADIDLLSAQIRANTTDAKFDLNGDGTVNADDRTTWVVDINGTWFGDSNLDGEFSSGDLVEVFQAGKFETDSDATWAQGDWDGDGRFGTGDLVTAFQDGGFEAGPRAATSSVPEPTSSLLILTGLCGLMFNRRKR